MIENTEQCTGDQLYNVVNKYITQYSEFAMIVINGIEGNYESTSFESLKLQYANSLFYYDKFFNTNCLWNNYDCSFKDAYNQYFINKVKENNIILCDKCYSMDAQSLERLKNVIAYCHQYKHKKIFILNCLVSLTGISFQIQRDILDNLLVQVPYKKIQILPLPENIIENALNLEPAYLSLDVEQKKEVVGWINNEKTLLQVIEAMRVLTHRKVDFSKYLKNNHYKFVDENLRNIYSTILSTLEDHLRKTLDIASVSGFHFYSKLLEKLHPGHCNNLKEIETNTKLILAKQYYNCDYVFLNEVAYNLILSMIDDVTKRNYQLNLACVARQLYDTNSSPSIRLLILEKMNEYLKSSTNRLERKRCLYQLINEYNKYYMFAECLNVIEEAASEYENDDIILFNLAKCYFELGRYTDCIKIIYRKHKSDFFILKMKAYYNNGEPYQVIRKCKRKYFSHWPASQKGELYSLLASSYEWIGKRASYVSYFKKAQQFLMREKNEAYYDLMRKINMVYDYDLEEQSNEFNISFTFFKNKKDYRKCAWVLHNWGTEHVLHIKDCDKGLNMLQQASDYLSDQLSMDKIDVENSIALYYMIKQEWEKANEIFERIQDKSNLYFCNLVYMLNKFHCLRKMNQRHECEKILKKLDDIFQSIKITADIQLQRQNYFVSKGIYMLEREADSEALTLFSKALRCMDETYYSYYTSVAAQKIVELSNNGMSIDTKTMLFAKRYAQSTNPAVLKMLEYNITFAEVMFWN